MGRPEEVLAEIEARADREGLVIIGKERGKILDQAMLEHTPERVLEVGTLVGYSAIRMARFLPPGGSLITVERDPAMARIARENISSAGLDGSISVIVGDALEKVQELPGRFHLVFIDAEKNQYLSYLTLVEDKIPSGGVVLADNVKRFADDVAPYLRHVRDTRFYSSSRYVESTSSFDPGGDAVEISVKR